jgi:hypothetical protein
MELVEHEFTTFSPLLFSRRQSMPSEEKTKPLSKAWEDVVEKWNISQEFAINLSSTTRKNKTLIGMRLDRRYQMPVARPFACKPGIVKLKNSNWGWMHEVVPVDQKSLAKCIDGHVKPGSHSKQTEHPEEYPNSIKVIPRKISLQEIIKSFTSGECELQKDPDHPNRILAVAKAGAPDATNVVFSIDMENVKSRQLMEDAGTTALQSIDQPDWWETEWGNFAIACQFEYTAQYKVGDGQFKDLEIFGIPVGDKVYPVGKDNDGFLRGISKKEYDELPPETREVVNTFDEGGAKEMLRRLMILHEHFWKKENPNREMQLSDKEQIAREVAQYKTETFGAGTPYDYYDAVRNLNKGRTADAFNYIQHSFESDNPLGEKYQSDINAPMLWSDPQGNDRVTYTEKEHIKFLMEHVDKQVFRVNPYWKMNMDMWGQVVLAQLKADMPVPQKTFDRFIEKSVEILKGDEPIDAGILKKYVEASLVLKDKGEELRTALFNRLHQEVEQKSKEEPESVRTFLVSSEFTKLQSVDPKNVAALNQTYREFVETSKTSAYLVDEPKVAAPGVVEESGQEIKFRRP